MGQTGDLFWVGRHFSEFGFTCHCHSLVQDGVWEPSPRFCLIERRGKMKLLIAVTTCWQNVICADAQRATWVKDSPIPIHFFLGKPKQGFPRQPKSDEVFLNC